MSSTETKPTIAFIGIGLMGSRMAKRLVSAGYTVSVYNRSPEKCRELGSLGARVAESIADAVTDADIVLTSLAGADAIETVYFGDQGIADSAPTDCLAIDLSSVAPDIAIDNHQRLKDAGLQHVDAPVTGGVSGAEAGTLSILVGGSTDNYQRALPVLSEMGNAFHLGDEGAGQVCKLVNQTIVHIFIGAVSEGLMLAASVGVDAAKVREALLGGYCQSRILDIHGDKMANRNFVPGGPLEFSVKDLEGAMKMAGTSDLNLPLTASVLEQYRGMVADGLGRLDHSALVMAYEKANPDIRVAADKPDTLP